jgi:hypothetical protein
MDETRNAYKILIGKSKSKRQFDIPKRRGENNMKINLKRNSVGGC